MNKRETQGAFRSSNAHLITNGSGYDLSIVNVWNQSGRLCCSAYQAKLTVFPTVDQSNMIPDASSAYVRFQGNPKDEYSVLCVDPETLCPIANCLAVPSQEIALSSEDGAQSKLSVNFSCRTTAYLTSELASSFTEVLQQFLQSQTTDKIHQWLQETDLYQKLHPLSIWLSASYMKHFPSVWLKEANRTTFYLYSALDTSDVMKKAPPIFVGSVELVRKEFDFVEIDPAKRYEVTFVDTKSQKTPLQYLNGVFSSNGICLKPTFINQSLLTNQEEENAIIAVVHGQVQGVSVFGTREELDLSQDSSGERDWYALWYPKNFSLWIQLWKKMAGTELAREVFLQKIEGLYRYIDLQTFPSSKDLPQTVQEAFAVISEEIEAEMAQAQEVYRDLGGKVADFPTEDAILQRQLTLREDVTSQIVFQTAITQFEAFEICDQSLLIIVRNSGGDQDSEELMERLKERKIATLNALQNYAENSSSFNGQQVQKIAQENENFSEEFYGLYSSFIKKMMEELPEQLQVEVDKNTQEEERIDLEIHYLRKVQQEHQAGIWVLNESLIDYWF